MSLQNIISRLLEDSDLINQIKAKISKNTVDLGHLDDFIVDTDQIVDLNIDPESLFSDLLTTKLATQHSLNLLQNGFYFTPLDEEMIPYNFETNEGWIDGDKISKEDSLIPNIIKIIILSRILSKSEKNNQLPLKCFYCDNSISDDDVKCPVCEADTGQSNRTNDNDNSSNDEETDEFSATGSPQPRVEGIGGDLSVLPRCPYCMSTLEIDATQCSICFADNISKSENQKVPIKENKVCFNDPKDKKDWICQYCHCQNLKNDNYCKICDTFAPFVKSWICGVCAYDNENTLKTCGACGEEYNYGRKVNLDSIEANVSSTVNLSDDLRNLDSIEMDFHGSYAPIPKEVPCDKCTFDRKNPSPECTNKDFYWLICRKCNAITINIRFRGIRLEECLDENIQKSISVLQSSIANNESNVNASPNDNQLFSMHQCELKNNNVNGDSYPIHEVDPGKLEHLSIKSKADNGLENGDLSDFANRNGNLNDSTYFSDQNDTNYSRESLNGNYERNNADCSKQKEENKDFNVQEKPSLYSRSKSEQQSNERRCEDNSTCLRSVSLNDWPNSSSRECSNYSTERDATDSKNDHHKLDSQNMEIGDENNEETPFNSYKSIHCECQHCRDSLNNSFE